MMTKREVSDWLETLPDDSSIGIDEGGLMLQSLPTPDGTAAYLELGGLLDEADEESGGERRCLYVMEPIGADGALEAAETLFFCSESCRNAIAENTEHTVKPGLTAEYIPGTVCDECGDEL